MRSGSDDGEPDARVGVVTPRSRGARRVFEYLRAGAERTDVEIDLIRPELARALRASDYDVLVAGDPSLAAQIPNNYDVIVVHDLGPHRTPHLFDGVYAPPGADRDRLERELSRCELITFSGTTAQLLEDTVGLHADVVIPGIDTRPWRMYGADYERPLADVGAIIPSTDPITKGLPFISEVKNSGRTVLIVTDRLLRDDWAHVHLARAADVIALEPTDEELARMRTNVWVAPGFEGFGLAPLEMHAATGATPVWTYSPELGPDPAKPTKFQVPRSTEGVERLDAPRPKFPLEKYTADRFAVRFIRAIEGVL